MGKLIILLLLAAGLIYIWIKKSEDDNWPDAYA